MSDKKYTMQILDGKGRIVKSETFFDIWEGEIREITLLPSEKKLLKDIEQKGNTQLFMPRVDYILESRGLKKTDPNQKYKGVSVKDGVLTIDPTNNEKE